MVRLTVSEVKKMTVPQMKKAMPFEMMADGLVIGVVKESDIVMPTFKTKCPNCGLIYDAKKPDDGLSYWTQQHPKT